MDKINTSKTTRLFISKINNLNNWQVIFILGIIGFAVYYSGIDSPFQGDDILQITNNPLVHSLSHIKLLFEGGTFYNGGGITKLPGAYYRPLMTTTFALLYTLFGQNPLPFHIVQVSLCIASAIILYIILKYFFNNLSALILSLIFLVHPMNSQVALAIPSMQDALMLFFGLASTCCIIKLSGIKSLILAGFCIFLSLLAKETAVIFIAIDALFIFLFDSRRRLYNYLLTMILPFILWFILRLKAVGLTASSGTGNAPIDRLDLLHRLIMMPQVVEFYISSFIFPIRQANFYDWTYSSISFKHFVLPLLIDILSVGLILMSGISVKRLGSKLQFKLWIFFTFWLFIGLLTCLQIVPLDGTVSLPWFYPSMPALLALAALSFKVNRMKINYSLLLVIVVIILSVLSFRTVIRGTDYSSSYKLSKADLSASSSDYTADDVLVTYHLNRHQFNSALPYATQAARIFPNSTTYESLGVALAGSGNNKQAVATLIKALKYTQLYEIYEDLGAISLVYTSNNDQAQAIFNSGLNKFPNDGTLYLLYAFYEEEHGNQSEADSLIGAATKYGVVSQSTYDDIITGHKFTLHLTNIGQNAAI